MRSTEIGQGFAVAPLLTKKASHVKLIATHTRRHTIPNTKKAKNAIFALVRSSSAHKYLRGSFASAEYEMTDVKEKEKKTEREKGRITNTEGANLGPLSN